MNKRLSIIIGLFVFLLITLWLGTVLELGVSQKVLKKP